MISEKHLIVCRRHWTAHIISGILIALWTISGLEELFRSGRNFSENLSYALAAFLCVSLLFAYVSASHKRYYIAMTENELVGHKGVFLQKRLSIPLTKVQEIGIETGILGNLFGYHTLTVNNAASGLAFRFSHMAKAEEFVATVQKRI